MEVNDISLLNAVRLPARLTVGQAAQLLGFQEHDIPVLVRFRLLIPLGSPAANGTKHFAAVKLEQLSQDESWLNRATRTIQQHWLNKNHGRSTAKRARGEFA